MRRFKTGTPARIHRDSIDFSKMEIQEGDEKIIPFSFMSDKIRNRTSTMLFNYTTNKILIKLLEII